MSGCFLKGKKDEVYEEPGEKCDSIFFDFFAGKKGEIKRKKK